MARTLNIDIYDLTEERCEAAVLLLRKLKRDVEGAIACVGRQDGIDLQAVTDALLICSSASLSFSEPEHVGTEKHVPLAKAETEVKTTGWPVTGGVVKNVAKENAEECGDCRIPRCRFCDAPGKRAGVRKDGLGRIVERYYVCETEGCLAAKVKTPQPANLFSGGK